MRAEEKELEGPELAQLAEQERQREVESEERELEELPQLETEALVDIELEHRSRVFDALNLILANEQLTVSLLGLPQRETHALEALQAAVTGRDSMNEFVFAEDRMVLLEQALAVLQANITHGDPAQLAALHARYTDMVERVGVLRDRLTNLEDAQDDLFEEKRQQYEEAKADGVDGDKDDPAPDAAADIAPAVTPEAQEQSITDLVGAALLALAEVQGLPSPPDAAPKPAQPEKPAKPDARSKKGKKRE